MGCLVNFDYTLTREVEGVDQKIPVEISGEFSQYIPATHLQPPEGGEFTLTACVGATLTDREEELIREWAQEHYDDLTSDDDSDRRYDDSQDR